MSDYKYDLPDLSGRKKAVANVPTAQGRPWWQVLGMMVAIVAIIAGIGFGGVGLYLSSRDSGVVAAAPAVVDQDVVPMVSPEDLATYCPEEQKSWDDWYHCMERVPGGVELLKHFDDDHESNLKIADVKRMMEKTPGKNARVIFVYPSASDWSDEKIREAAAADVKVDVSSMNGLKIVKVTDLPAEWQTIINTRKLEENIYSPFVDTRTDVDQVRVSLAPLNDKGEVELKEPWAGVFTSCGNKHWQRKLAPGTPVANTPVVSTNRTTIVSTPPSTRTTTRTSTITSPPTTTPPVCIDIVICNPTTTTPPTTTYECPPGYVEVNGLCKDYGNGPGSVIPTSLQPNPLPVDPDLEESTTPDVPSPTSQYTPPPPVTSVQVDPTLTQEPTSSPPPPAETEAPTTTVTEDLSGM